MAADVNNNFFIYTLHKITPDIKTKIGDADLAVKSLYPYYQKAYRDAFIPSHYPFSSYLLHGKGEFNFTSDEKKDRYREVAKIYCKAKQELDAYIKEYGIVKIQWIAKEPH